MEFGLRGPVYSVTTACASANHAIGQAMHMIRSGMADFVLTGGSDASITVGFMKGWEALRVLSPQACRPFSRDRTGLVIGEGAGMFVLESAGHARARGATVLAEIAGLGMSADAADMTAPTADGGARAMQAPSTTAVARRRRSGTSTRTAPAPASMTARRSPHCAACSAPGRTG